MMKIGGISDRMSVWMFVHIMAYGNGVALLVGYAVPPVRLWTILSMDREESSCRIAGKAASKHQNHGNVFIRNRNVIQEVMANTKKRYLSCES